MGNARWDATDWSRYSAHTAHKSRAETFTARGMAADYDPKLVALRESVDSEANPQSTPVIVALDGTGSMGQIPHKLIQGKLGTLMQELLARKPVPDPHLMFMVLGDVECDRVPLQVTQFEADIRIADQLKALYLEGGGGANHHESYHLPWYFAATKTKTDAATKRQKKGYLFTVGDEEPPCALTPDQVAQVFGLTIEQPLPLEEILAMAEAHYEVFHIMVEQGHHYQAHGARVRERWADVMGQRAIPLSDIEALAEVIVATIQLNEGLHHDAVVNSWDAASGKAIGHALKGLAVRSTGTTGGLVAL